MAEIERLNQLMESIKTDFNISQITYFENLPSMAVVGIDYVSYRFGCSQNAVIRGRFNTDKIPRFRNKPIAFLKRDVDTVWMTLTEPVWEKAAKLRDQQNKRKKFLS